MKKKNRLFVLLMILCGLIPCATAGSGAAQKNAVKLYCLNIGKADCMLLLCGDKTYLIDSGYEHSFPALKTALSQLNITHLDGVFLSHCHQDHAGGLLQLFESDLAIDKIYAADIYYDVKENKHPAVLAAKERNMKVHFLRQGDIVTIDEDTSFTVLGPVHRDEENENNNSLVMRFASPHGSILFAGDMKLEEESDLLERNLFSPCDVLKCGHHGDDKATSTALIRALRPQCAVILTDSREEKDTPSMDTLNRLRSYKVTPYVSQDSQDALCLTLFNGDVQVEDVAWPSIPKRIENLQMKMNIKDDLITLKNTGKENISFSDAILYSSNGNDVYPLPDISLKPNETYLIGSKKTDTQVDFKIDKKSVWHEKKLDTAILYDAYGRILAATDNGKPEN